MSEKSVQEIMDILKEISAYEFFSLGSEYDFTRIEGVEAILERYRSIED